MLNLARVYGVWGSVRLMRDLVLTKMFYPNARIVRYPNYIRGVAGIRLAPGLTTGVGLRIDVIDACSEKLFIGRDVQLNDYVHIGVAESVKIGDNVLIASRVFITDHNHGAYSGTNQSDPNEIQVRRPLSSAAVVIEDNVWIGEGVSILPGVTIGRNSVVACGTVVTRSVPANVITGGVPNRIIKVWNAKSRSWERPKEASLDLF